MKKKPKKLDKLQKPKNPLVFLRAQTIPSKKLSDQPYDYKKDEDING